MGILVVDAAADKVHSGIGGNKLRGHIQRIGHHGEVFLVLEVFDHLQHRGTRPEKQGIPIMNQFGALAANGFLFGNVLYHTLRYAGNAADTIEKNSAAVDLFDQLFLF